MSCCGNGNKKKPGGIGIPDSCCTADTGCVDFNRNLSNVKVEPIYVQKVYDAALFHLQSLVNGIGIELTPALPVGSNITEVLAIRCRKFFDPANSASVGNLKINPTTQLQGASFVKNAAGVDLTAVGPDGFDSQKLIYVDTAECDSDCLGTPIYGTQNISVSGNVEIEIDVNIRQNCGKRCKVTLTGRVPVGTVAAPLNLTNFFELCVPSTSSGAFLPRFTEFCNLNCEPRLATNNINRDFIVAANGEVSVNIMVAICVSCEKKVIVPVQLCVLSTGFPQLSPETSSVCSSYPSLFPNQIDKDSVKECLRDKKDDDCHRPSKPGNSPRYQGLSLSEEDDVEDSDEV